MAATYHHARRLYIGTTAERAAVVLDVDGIGTDYWDTDVGVLYIWDGTAWVAGFAALPHSILSVTHADTTPAVVVRGDLMTGQGVAPLWQRLAHPGALYHFQTDANDVGWLQDILMVDDGFIGAAGLLNAKIIFDYTPAPNEIHVDDAALVMDKHNILPAGAGQDLGSGIARWDVFAAFVDLPGTGWVGVGPASERLIFNVAGDATFAGVTSVVVPDGCWVGADAACSWVYNSTGGFVTTLDWVGIGTIDPAELSVFARLALSNDSVTDLSITAFRTAAGAHGRVTFGAARGTSAVPVALVANDRMGDFSVVGYHSGAAWGIESAYFGIKAAENFAVGAQGTYFAVNLTQIGTVVRAEKFRIADTGNVGILMSPTANGVLCLNLPTENLEIIDAGSAGATEQDWIEVEVGGVQGFIRVFAAI